MSSSAFLNQNIHLLNLLLKDLAPLRGQKYPEKMVHRLERVYRSTRWNNLNIRPRTASSLVIFNSSTLANVCIPGSGLHCCLTYAKTVLAFVSTPPKLIITPKSLYPPELVFQHVLTEAVDIWNLGFTVRGSTPSSIRLTPRKDLRAGYRLYAFPSMVSR